MVAVTNYYILPLREEVTGCFRQANIHTPACILAPHEVAELVCPVEETLLEDLLVEACAIETYCHRHLDIVLQSLVAWSSPDTVMQSLLFVMVDLT